jgi:hypothetical protein
MPQTNAAAAATRIPLPESIVLMKVVFMFMLPCWMSPIHSGGLLGRSRPDGSNSLSASQACLFPGMESEVGEPQGATVSPLLPNIYLHYVLDLWVQRSRTKEAHGDVIVVRYADDFIVGFQHRTDAERFLLELRGRLAKFLLELNPDETRLVAFGPLPSQDVESAGSTRDFNFLGFTHVCARTRQGRFLLSRHTMRTGMTTKLHEVSAGMRRRRHDPIPNQGQWLASGPRSLRVLRCADQHRRARSIQNRCSQQLVSLAPAAKPAAAHPPGTECVSS